MILAVEVHSKKPVLYVLNKDELYVGSHVSNDVVIESREISRKHLKVVVKEDRCFVVDQGSTNGTYLNDEKLPPGKREEFLPSTTIRLADRVFLTLIDESMPVPDAGSPVTKETSIIRSIDERTRIISLKDLEAAKAKSQKKQEEANRKVINKTSFYKEKNRTRQLNRVFLTGSLMLSMIIVMEHYSHAIPNKYKFWLNPAKRVMLMMTTEDPDELIEGGFMIPESRLLGRVEVKDLLVDNHCAVAAVETGELSKFCQRLPEMKVRPNLVVEYGNIVLFYIKQTSDKDFLGRFDARTAFLNFLKDSLDDSMDPLDYRKDFYVVHYYVEDEQIQLKSVSAVKGSVVPALARKYSSFRDESEEGMKRNFLLDYYYRLF
jgi:pSer/pThr/pTyr-binding forkhead associated (FHA) protein